MMGISPYRQVLAGEAIHTRFTDALLAFLKRRGQSSARPSHRLSSCHDSSGMVPRGYLELVTATSGRHRGVDRQDIKNVPPLELEG